MTDITEADNASFFGFIGIAGALVFANLGALLEHIKLE